MKKSLRAALSVLVCLGMLTTVFAVALPVSALEENALQFGSDGKFKIMVLADCQDDASPDARMMNFIAAALDHEKPDLVVFTGDNVVVSSSSAFRTGATALLQPLVDRNIPYAYTYGNHDAENGVSKETQYSIYKEIGNCLTYDAAPSITGFGNCNLPIYSSDGTSMAFNLWMIDSNMYDGSNYDYVHQDQLDWLTSTQNAITAAEGRTVNSILFQHIIVPEAYNLLTEATLGAKSYNGKRYSQKLNSNATGYLGEFPCPPVVNSGEYATVCSMGGVLGMVFGHDHSNSFIGKLNGVDLIQSPGITFSSYGDANCRGCRVIEINEADTSTYETHTLLYTTFESGGFGDPIPEDEAGITEYSYPAGTRFISEITFAADNDSATAKNAVTSGGFTLIDYDLNKGAGSSTAFVYMGYKTTTSYADSIKSIRYINAGSGDVAGEIVSRQNDNNCTYRKVNSVDLNKGCGGDTAYIYGYITREAKAGPALTELTVSNTSSIAGFAAFTSFSAVNTAFDLNITTSGDTVYNLGRTVTVAAINSSALRAAYNAAVEASVVGYSAESVAALNNAKNAAKAVIDELDACGASTANQNTIDTLASSVTSAIAGLGHTVTYKNYDGSFFAKEQVPSGDNAIFDGVPVKPSDAQYNYVFSGWDGTLENITADTEVTAQFTPVHYHSGGNATCCSVAICSFCHEPYSSLDSSVHEGGAVVRGASAQSCCVNGYTGDTFCMGCDVKIASGTVIPADGVSHSGGTANCVSPAVCRACGNTYGEKNPAIHAGGTFTTGYIAATCNTAGYSGDKYCAGCRVKLEEGSAIEATGIHTGGTASCCEKAVCDNCGIQYGEFDATNHVGAKRIENVRLATCTKTGYTGDTFCLSCNQLVSAGRITEKAEHNYGEWTVTRAATCTATGSKESVCTGCGDKKVQSIAMVSHTPSAEDKYVCAVCGAILGKPPVPETPDEPSGNCGCCDEHNHGDSFIERIQCFFCKLRHFFMNLFGG